MRKVEPIPVVHNKPRTPSTHSITQAHKSLCFGLACNLPTYLIELQQIDEQKKAINIHIITEIGSFKYPEA